VVLGSVRPRSRVEKGSQMSSVNVALIRLVLSTTVSTYCLGLITYTVPTSWGLFTRTASRGVGEVVIFSTGRPEGEVLEEDVDMLLGLTDDLD
jgi:hypothetical protein